LVFEKVLTMPRPVPREGRWVDRHSVVNFYASDEIRGWIDDEMRRTGMSKTQVIIDAIEAQRRRQGSSAARRRRLGS
jgi:hypothetical protein